MTKVLRGEVYWVNLDPTVGAQIKKTRPCLVVSPDDMNAVLPRVIIAPITSKGQPLGCRPEVVIGGKQGRMLLDQIRCVDNIRLTRKMGEVDTAQWHSVPAHPEMLELLACRPTQTEYQHLIKCRLAAISSIDADRSENRNSRLRKRIF